MKYEKVPTTCCIIEKQETNIVAGFLKYDDIELELLQRNKEENAFNQSIFIPHALQSVTIKPHVALQILQIGVT